MSYAMVSGGDALPLPEHVDFDSALVQLSHVNEALHRSQIMAGSVNPDSMTGEMVEAWKREIEKLTGAVRRVSGMVHAVGQAIDSYKCLYRQTVTDVKGMQEEWDGDMRAFKVIDVLGEGATDDQKKSLKDKQFELAGRYNRRIEKLDSEAETLSKKIESILGDLAPSAGKVGAGAGRRPDHNDLGVALFGGGGILGAQTMAANAEADAADFSRLVSDVDEDGVPTKKALEEMKKKGYLDRLGTDPYFCAAVAAKINPKRMADLGRKLDARIAKSTMVTQNRINRERSARPTWQGSSAAVRGTGCVGNGCYRFGSSGFGWGSERHLGDVEGSVRGRRGVHESQVGRRDDGAMAERLPRVH